MAGDVAFDEFYLATRADLLRQLTAMTGDPELAQDVLQESYARGWQRWSRVSGLEDPSAWVRTVAWRLAVSQFRRRKVADRFAAGLRRRTVDVPAPEAVWDLDSALRQLNPVFRQALVLHELYGYPVEQIAHECGVAVGTVKSRLSRGRAALAAALGADYQEPAREDSR